MEAGSRWASSAAAIAASGYRWVRSGPTRTTPPARSGDRLAELVPVDHRSAHVDLPADHPEELDPRRVVGQPREDHPPAGTHDADLAQGQLHGLGGPGGLDDQVDPVPPGEASRRVGDRLAGPGDGGVSAELPRQAEPPLRASHDQDAAAARAEQLEREQPERPGPHHRRALRRPGRRAAHRARHHRERLREEEDLGSEPGRGRPARALRQDGQLGEPAVAVDAHRGPRQAQVAAPLTAEVARPAAPVRLDRDAVPHGDPADVRPDRHDVSDELVPGNQRVPDVALAGPDPVVGPADPGGGHADHRLTRQRRRVAGRYAPGRRAVPSGRRLPSWPSAGGEAAVHEDDLPRHVVRGGRRR